MVGIVILNYNNSAQTIECIESLRRCCPGGNWKVCVVDNASAHDQWEALQAVRDDALVTVLRADTNGGYACGNDIGCRFFDGDPSVDNILILNDDTLFTQDILTPMEEYLAAYKNCGVVFPLVLAPDGSIDKACMRRQKTICDLVLQATSLGRFGVKRKEFISGDPAVVKDLCKVPPGSCMMLPKAVFREIGWLDPGTFLYFEEHILLARLSARGYDSAFMPEISIIHKGAQTTKKQPSKAVYRHWRNSYLHFMRNYADVPALLVQLLRLRTWFKTL